MQYYPIINYIGEAYINESQESKSIDAAKKLYMLTKSVSKEDADKFIRITLRDEINALREKDLAKFILGCTRMYLNNELDNTDNIVNLNKILLTIQNNEIDKFDRNLNNLSFDELYSKYQNIILLKTQVSKDELNSIKFEKNNKYQIFLINSFEDALKFNDIVPWCICDKELAYKVYVTNKNALFYFCIRKDYKNIKKEKGTNYPLDAYGLSCFAVSIDSSGELLTCTCRWNSGGPKNDHIMDEKQISLVIGQNFYDIFKPTKLQLHNQEKIQESLNKNIDFLKNSNLYRKIINYEARGYNEKDIIPNINYFYYEFLNNSDNDKSIILWKNLNDHENTKGDGMLFYQNNKTTLSLKYAPAWSRRYVLDVYNKQKDELYLAVFSVDGTVVYQIKDNKATVIDLQGILIYKQLQYSNYQYIATIPIPNSKKYGIYDFNNLTYLESPELNKLLGEYKWNELLDAKLTKEKVKEEITYNTYLTINDKNIFLKKYKEDEE